MSGVESCVIVIRILRDLCSRVSTWAPLKGWVSQSQTTKNISLQLDIDECFFINLYILVTFLSMSLYSYVLSADS